MAASMREAGLLRAQPVQMLPEVSVRTAAPPVQRVLAGTGQCDLALRVDTGVAQPWGTRGAAVAPGGWQSWAETLAPFPE